MSSFEDAWRLVKEDEPDCDCITTDMSGNCLHCGKTSAESMNEREGGGWEDCPGCCVARRIGEMCHNQDPKHGREHCDGGISKAMTDEEMVYVKMPKSMLPLLEQFSTHVNSPDSPLGQIPFDQMTKLPESINPLIDRFGENPDIYHDSGYDGNMAGHYGGYSLSRPDMKDMYDPYDEGMSPLGDDFTGEYHGDEGNIRGELSKLKLIDALRNMGLMG